jgi:anti-sigma regulatory factor (Ser/Thr protein kinase)
VVLNTIGVDWERLFEEGLEPQLLLDPMGGVLRANRAAVRLLGTDPPSLVGLPCLRLIAAAHRQAWLEVVHGVRHRSDPGSLRCPLTVSGRELGVFDVTVAPLIGQGTASAHVTLRDASGDAARDRRIAHLEGLHHGHREAVAALVAAIEPRPPPSRLDVGIATRAADAFAPIGGDLHDWQWLSDGTLHLSVVDATGSGTLATRAALTVRDAARVLAVAGCPIGDLLARTESVCAVLDAGLSAAVVIVRYDPADGRLAIVSAGHPPVLLRRRDGRIERIGTPGPPLGFADGDRAPPHLARLDDGDLVVVATDGVVEGWGRAEAGLTALGAVVRRIGGPTVTATAVAEGSFPGVTHDDAAVIALRHGTSPSRRTVDDRDHGSFRIVVREARVSDVTTVRHELGDWLRDRSIAPGPRRRALLLVSELVSNAVGTAPARIELAVQVRASALELEVHDDGVGFDLERAVTRVGGGGFGLLIADDLSDDLHVASGPAGTVVRARIDLPHRSPT